MKRAGRAGLCALLAVSLAAFGMAQASRPGAHPLDYSVAEYGLLLAVAVLGGAAGWYGRFKAAPSWPKVTVAHLVGELTTSAFAGLIAFWLCSLGGAPELLTISVVGMAGHMGGRFLMLVEGVLEKRIASKAE